MAPKKKMTSKQKRGRSRTGIPGSGKMANIKQAKGGRSGNTRTPDARRVTAFRSGKRG